VTAGELAAWAADAFARYDLAATHRIVTAATGAGPLPDYVSARLDPATGTVALPRPAGVVLARGENLDEVIRLALLTRNALLADTPQADRVRRAAALAEEAGAPVGVLQPVDGPAAADVVIDVPPTAPVIVIADAGAHVATTGPDAVVLTVGDGYADLGQAVRAARALLRETGGDRLRVHSPDPAVPARIAAALPVTRVAVGDGEMPPPAPDGLLSWIRIGARVLPPPRPRAAPAAVPPYPRASNDPSLR